MTLTHVEDPFLVHLLSVVKKIRVKDTRKIFVLLRKHGYEYNVDNKSERGAAPSEDLSGAVDVLFANEGITFGEFTVGYILNNQCRERRKITCV